MKSKFLYASGAVVGVALVAAMRLAGSRVAADVSYSDIPLATKIAKAPLIVTGTVVDVAPTILEAAGLPEPKSVNGTAQTPMEGGSFAYTFADPKAASRHTTQYACRPPEEIRIGCPSSRCTRVTGSYGGSVVGLPMLLLRRMGRQARIGECPYEAATLHPPRWIVEADLT